MPVTLLREGTGTSSILRRASVKGPVALMTPLAFTSQVFPLSVSRTTYNTPIRNTNKHGDMLSVMFRKSHND